MKHTPLQPDFDTEKIDIYRKNRACQAPFPRLPSPLFLRVAKDGGRQNPLWARAATGKKYFMAVRIRMKRIGAKNKPAFRIVVADSRSPRDGKCIEELGTYQPAKKGTNFTLDLPRAQYWLSKGAQPSETVASFIKQAIKTAAAAPA